MFQRLYDNPLLVTTLPCVTAGLVVVAALLRGGFARVFGVVFAIGIAADAYLNGPLSPVRGGTAMATTVSVFFVIFGDFRYFVVLEHALQEKLGLIRAAGWAFVVPVSAQLVRWAYPRIERDERSTFLLYEIFFLALVVWTWFLRLPHGPSWRVRLARRATQFELVQYALWAGADVGLMKTGNDAFYAARLAANLMYYVAFVPVMLRLLPKREAQ